VLKELRHSILSGIMLITLAQTVAADIVNIQFKCNKFKSNKVEYICGEPVLLKTTISNPSGSKFTGNASSYSWRIETGFSMLIACGDSDFIDILNKSRSGGQIHGGVGAAPEHLELWYDRHSLPSTLLAGEQAERVDLLIFPKPGDYKLKAVLKDRDGTVRASEPIQIRIVSLEETDDSIAELGKQDFVINLGSAIYYAHHMEMLMGGYRPGESLDGGEFAKIAPVIIKKHKDSVFREYVMYADIMANGRLDVLGWPLIRGRKDLAYRFAKEYPDSWLLPEVYRKLFWTHVVARDKKKAEDVRKKAMKLAPHARGLRRMRYKDLSKMKPPRKKDPDIYVPGGK
jgi:hypothetical protein